MEEDVAEGEHRGWFSGTVGRGGCEMGVGKESGISVIENGFYFLDVLGFLQC